MADQRYIDNIAETIASQTDALQQEMVRDLLKLSKDKRFKSIDEFLLAIDQLDLEQIVRLKAQNIINGYIAAHTQILTDMTLFADVTENTLRGLTNFSTSSFADSLGNGTGETVNAIMYLFNFANASEYSFMTVESARLNLTPDLSAHQGGIVHTVASASDGIKFFMESSVNMNTGAEFALYGLNK